MQKLIFLLVLGLASCGLVEVFKEEAVYTYQYAKDLGEEKLRAEFKRFRRKLPERMKREFRNFGEKLAAKFEEEVRDTWNKLKGREVKTDPVKEKKVRQQTLEDFKEHILPELERMLSEAKISTVSFELPQEVKDYVARTPRLKDVHPYLKTLFYYIDRLHFNILIVQGGRSVEQALQNFLNKVSKLDPRKGQYSKHIKGIFSPWANAVDYAPLVGKKIDWEDTDRFVSVSTYAEQIFIKLKKHYGWDPKVCITVGFNWKSKRALSRKTWKDYGHIEIGTDRGFCEDILEGKLI